MHPTRGLMRLTLLLATVLLPTVATAQELDLPPSSSSGPSVPSSTIGGYGELHLNSTLDAEGKRSGQIDFHRFVLFFGHQYDPSFRFYSELETEHAFAGPGEPGEVELEQAFIGYAPLPGGPEFRAGLVLVPFGHLNTIHEPTAFHGVERPKVDSIVIPTTWREAGLGVAGKLGDAAGYEAYLISGLNAADFSTAKGLREGRTGVAEAYAGAPAVVARIHAEPLVGLEVAGSFYHGDAGANHPDKKLNLTVTGAAFDLRYKAKAIEARSEIAAFSLSDTDKLAAAGTPGVGSLITGGYVEVGVDVLELAGRTQEVVPFVRYETYDTTAEVAEGLVDPATAATDLVVGVTWRPIPQIALKADHIVRTPEQGDATQMTSLGVGYLF